MNKDTQLTIGFFLSLVLFGLLSYALLGAPAARLPDPVAIQWGFTGKPGNYAPLVIFRAIALGTGAVLCGLQLRALIKLARANGFDQGRGPMGLMAMGISISSIALAILWSNLDAPSWQDAQISWPATLGALALSLGASAQANREKSSPTPEPKVHLGLEPGEQAVWVKQVSSRLFLYLAAGLAPVFLIPALVRGSVGPIECIGYAIAAIAVVSLAWIRVHVSNHGLRVYYGFWPMAFTRIPLEEIRSASVEDLNNAIQHGGWGYRGSLRLLKRATIFIRSGPGLRLDLTRDRVLRITVDDPHTAAGLLNDLCEQRNA